MNNAKNNANVALALMAHPDDPEFLCGGTLALLKAKGWEVHIATATAGDCGTSKLSREEISAIRRKEAAAAAAVLGGTHHCLEQFDLLVKYDKESLTAACGVLREVCPQILIIHSPVDYIVDHEQASLIGRAASFAAPVPNAPASEGSRPLDAVPHLYYADPVECKDSFGKIVEPGLVVNIDTTIETKLEMLACHASQREWLRDHHGMDEYIETARRWSKIRAELAGCTFAEGFRQHLGHGYPQDDLLGATLGDQATRLPS